MVTPLATLTELKAGRLQTEVRCLNVPTSLVAFLDGLAGLIADAIVEESGQGAGGLQEECPRTPLPKAA